MLGRRIGIPVVQVLIALALPVALVLGDVFLLASDTFIHHEYSKASFPADAYYPMGGYSMPLDERESLAKLGLASVLQPDGIRLLEQARFRQTGELAFNDREIRHMTDVNVLIQKVRYVFWGALAVVVVGAAALLLLKRGRALARSLWTSSILSPVVFLGLGLFIVVNFTTFFTTFHHVFFKGDTWLFLYTDTLIRIYPTKLWFDVSLYLSVAALVELALIATGSRLALARVKAPSR
jgi:integral membrane protein (TIGR01906 family)